MSYIIDPSQAAKYVISPTTRLLHLRSPCIQKTFRDPDDKSRIWTIIDAFMPVEARIHLGVRFRCIDSRGYTSFVPQRDLEVLMRLAEAGSRIPWHHGAYYVSPFSETTWVGVGMSKEDLLDDLFVRECTLRIERYSTQPIPVGSTITRHLYVRNGNDGMNYEEQLSCAGDADPHSGYGPCPDVRSVETRWNSVSRTRGFS